MQVEETNIFKRFNHVRFITIKKTNVIQELMPIALKCHIFEKVFLLITLLVHIKFREAMFKA